MEARRARVLGLVLAGTLLASSSAAAPPVRIQVRGIDGDLKRNVIASLSIADRAERKRASEGYLRSLHSRAEEEIRRALEPFGYYRPIIRSELIVGRQWIARYDVTPGPAILLDSVEVRVTGEGASDPGFQKLLAEFPLRKGEVLIHPAYERGKASFEGHAAQAGFLDAYFARTRVHVDLERYAAAIDLRMETGPRHYFGPATFEQEVIAPGVLDHFPTFRPGEVFDFRKLLQLQKDLSETGWFTRVEVQRGNEDSTHRVVPIEVTLGPARPLRFTAGAGYGTDDGARGRGLVEMRRLNRQGHHAQLELQLAQIEKSAGVSYIVPWPFPRTDRVNLHAGYQDLRTDVSTSKSYQTGASITRVLGSWQASVALNYRSEEFSVGPDLGTARFLTPEGTWSRTRSDERLVLRTGDRVRLQVRGASDVLLSDVDFFQPRAEGKLIYGFGRMRFLGRIEGGYTSTTAFRRLPPSVRFFAGGANSVRGYAYNSLGPRDSLGRVVGGEHLLTGSVETEYMFLPRWGAAVFYDTGNAVNSIHDPLMTGVGVGLRWVSPMGWVRGDIAWGLDREGRPVEIHLTVGPEL